ncbi:MAG: isoprenylcysteine carboxylmethyltransferase family protein [Pseudomonadota bacterium]
MVEKKRFVAKLMMFIATFCGGASFFLFLIFLFFGPFQFVNMGLSGIWLLLWDGALSILFFIQHSCMIRRRFRLRLSKVITLHYNNAVFSIASGIMLTVALILWQTSNSVFYELTGVFRWLIRGIFFAGIAGSVWGVFSLKKFDPFGNSPIRSHLSEKLLTPQRFTVYGPYLWVRHPLYFFLIVLIWSCPDMTIDRLLFNFLWTVWIFIGTVMEEKDMVSDFGDAYQQYQDKVPMLIPWKGRWKAKTF